MDVVKMLKESIIPLYRDNIDDDYNRGYDDCYDQVLEKNKRNRTFD